MQVPVSRWMKTRRPSKSNIRATRRKIYSSAPLCRYSYCGTPLAVFTVPPVPVARRGCIAPPFRCGLLLLRRMRIRKVGHQQTMRNGLVLYAGIAGRLSRLRLQARVKQAHCRHSSNSRLGTTPTGCTVGSSDGRSGDPRDRRRNCCNSIGLTRSYFAPR
jgi:hypothetical protein